MIRTQVTGNYIKDTTVERDDLNITSTGKAVIRKILTSTGVTAYSTGVDGGTGDVTLEVTLDFTGIQDTPSSYTGQDDKLLIVDETGTQIVFDKVKNVNVDDNASISWTKLDKANSQLSDLSNIDITDISEKKILIWSSTGNKWIVDTVKNEIIDENADIAWTKINKSGSILNDIDNVDVNSITDGKFLMYSSTGTNWVPGNIATYVGLTTEDTFIAIQDQTTFTLTATPSSKAATIVSLNGMLIASDEYTLNGLDLILDYGINENTKVTIKYGTYGGLSNRFIDQNDTPGSYNEHGGEYVKVNNTSSGLEFSSYDSDILPVATGQNVLTNSMVIYAEDGIASFSDINMDCTIGSSSIFESDTTDDCSVALLTDTKAITAYTDSGNANKGTACVLSISGTTVTAGAPTIFDQNNSFEINLTALSDTKAIVVYRDFTNSNYGTACVLTIDGTNITQGTPYVFYSGFTRSPAVTALSENKAIVAYSGSSQGRASVLMINGDNITAGTSVIFRTTDISYISITALMNTQVILAYIDNNASNNYGRTTVLNISGTIITIGSSEYFAEAFIAFPFIVALSSTKALIMYSLVNSANYGNVRIVTINNTTLSFGTSVTFASVFTSDTTASVFCPGKVIVTYRDQSHSSYGKTCILSISGNTITVGNTFTFEEAESRFSYVATLTDSKAIVVYKNVGNLNYGTARILAVDSANRENIIGMATQDKSAGEDCIVALSGKVDYTCTPGVLFYTGADGQIFQTNFPYSSHIPRLPKPSSSSIGIGVSSNKILLRITG